MKCRIVHPKETRHGAKAIIGDNLILHVRALSHADTQVQQQQHAQYNFVKVTPASVPLVSFDLLSQTSCILGATVVNLLVPHAHCASLKMPKTPPTAVYEYTKQGV